METDASTFDYDVAVTFAGEDRAYVNGVVDLVKEFGYSVFYDEDEQATLWGEELTEYFPDIYERRARFAVMFISTDYAAKPWTRLERRSVLLRALSQETPYLLPVRLDQTVLPGVRNTISYLDGRDLGPAQIAEAIRKKLGAPALESIPRFNGLVPRTEHEAAILLGERPPGWEYIFFSYSLVSEFAKLNGRYLDYRIGFSSPSGFIPKEQITDFVRSEYALSMANVRNFEKVLSQEAQTAAFGAPGESGNVETITHLAQRLAAVYEEFMNWGERIRGCATNSDEARDVLETLSHYSDQPIQRLHDFPFEFRGHADNFSGAIEREEPVNLSMVVPLEISKNAQRKFQKALMKFRRHLT